MMNIETSRYKLPLLAVGQAQKEYTHNEALLLIDNLLHPSVITILDNPESIDNGQDETDKSILSMKTRAWLIGNEPIGIWSDRANQLAILTANGFRYIHPRGGMKVYNEQLGCIMMYKDMSWHIAPNVSEPAGGDVVDSQSRESIAAIIAILEQFGLSRP